MEVREFYEYLNGSRPLIQAERQDLERLSRDFPFFHAAHVLLCAQLYAENLEYGGSMDRVRTITGRIPRPVSVLDIVQGRPEILPMDRLQVPPPVQQSEFRPEPQVEEQPGYGRADEESEPLSMVPEETPVDGPHPILEEPLVSSSTSEMGTMDPPPDPPVVDEAPVARVGDMSLPEELPYFTSVPDEDTAVLGGEDDQSVASPSSVMESIPANDPLPDAPTQPPVQVAQPDAEDQHPLEGEDLAKGPVSIEIELDLSPLMAFTSGSETTARRVEAWVKPSPRHHDPLPEPEEDDEVEGDGFRLSTPISKLTPEELRFVNTVLNPSYTPQEVREMSQSELITAFLERSKEVNLSRELIEKANAREDLDEEEDPRDLLLNTEIASERLAKILSNSGEIAAAILMYERLMAKYPEKSVYFATVIEELKDRPA